jgi:hypothetical protein
MLKSISATKKDLTQGHPASSYNNNCLRAEDMRNSFKNYHNNEFINLNDKQRKTINFWIDSIMMK